ncbi:MAG TPA: hypothetical protein PK760_10640 [Flavobacteriales bacterium]|nr:hypothetical protein [Flavobacteriales bacterium]
MGLTKYSCALAMVCAIAAAYSTGCGSRQVMSEEERLKSEGDRNMLEHQRMQAQKTKMIFTKSYGEKAHDRFAGTIVTDTTHSLRYVQYDSARIYLDATNQFSSIFISGLISNQLIYCDRDTSCRPPDPSAGWTYGDTGEPVLLDTWGWKGPTIFISEVEEVLDIKCKKTQRRFRIELHDRNPGSGGFSVYLIELTNDNASREDGLESFMREARLTFFRYGWSEI